jgi:hypothetical protein
MFRNEGRQLIGNRCRAIGTGYDAHQGDPDLHRRQETGWVSLQVDHRFGTHVSLIRLCLEPRSPGGDDGQLRHRKNTVHHDQSEKDKEFDHGALCLCQ